MSLVMLPTIDNVKLMTGEELAMRDDLERGELIKGVFVKMPPPGSEHGRIETSIAFFLKLYAREHKSGEVFSGEVGIYTKRNPDTIRAMDVAYVSNQRMKQHTTHYFAVPPEIVIEVLSPGNRWVEILDKVDEYLNIGVDLVWIVDPKRKEVFSYHTLDKVTRYAMGDVLTASEILPNFELPIEELFA